jgi:t-SNARE complex subunit (syntaxin)
MHDRPDPMFAGGAGYSDEEFERALESVRAARRREFRHTLRTVCVCAAVIALAALAAWAVVAFQ